MFRRTPKKSFFLFSTDHSRSVLTRSIAGYIMMHDVNIEEETKCKTSVLALLLFSSLYINI